MHSVMSTLVKKVAIPPDQFACELCGEPTTARITITVGEGYKAVCPKCYRESKWKNINTVGMKSVTHFILVDIHLKKTFAVNVKKLDHMKKYRHGGNIIGIQNNDPLL